MAMLNDLQQKFETEYNQPFLKLTLHETLKKLISLDKETLAIRLRNEFKVSEIRYWYLKIEAFTDALDFENLEKLARSKKSPVGYEPFVKACIKHQNLLEAKKYILKCETNRRAELYFNMGSYKEAAESAFSTKNVDVLEAIKRKTQNNSFSQELESMIISIGGRK